MSRSLLRLFSVLPALLAFAAVGAHPLAGQKLSPVEPGSRIRVHVPSVADAPIIGTLLSMNPDLVRFAMEGGFPTFAVRLDSIARLDVSAGLASSGAAAVRGGGIGLVVGTIPSGLVLAGARCFVADDGLPDACTPEIRWAAAVVVVASTAVGAVIGALTPVERWRRVGLPIRFGAAPKSRAGGLAVGIATPF
ncbi:MAG: hypothetical protein HY704_12775 [Gemmatimonadetes bacterium]|nr:hypothetical protein [Gemmatimonadota bacterium]